MLFHLFDRSTGWSVGMSVQCRTVIKSWKITAQFCLCSLISITSSYSGSTDHLVLCGWGSDSSFLKGHAMQVPRQILQQQQVVVVSVPSWAKVNVRRMLVMMPVSIAHHEHSMPHPWYFFPHASGPIIIHYFFARAISIPFVSTADHI